MIILSQTSPSNWDANLERYADESGFLQSSCWGKIIIRVDPARTFYFQSKEGSQITSQALLVLRYPFDRRRNRKLFFLPYLECLDGPVILDHERAAEIISGVIRESLKLARRSLATSIRFSFSRTSQYLLKKEIAEVFRKSGFQVSTHGTFLVDLSPDEEKLFAGIKHSARKSVKKCLTNGSRVVKIRSFEEYKERFWSAYSESKEYFGDKPNPSEVMRSTWEEDKGRYYHHYIVEDRKHLTLACLGMYIFNGVATEITSSISPEAYEKKIPVQDLLHWEILLEAKRMGCRTFDLAGVTPNPANKKEEGIRRFKGKWGGNYTEYNTYHKGFLPYGGKIRNLVKKIIGKA